MARRGSSQRRQEGSTNASPNPNSRGLSRSHKPAAPCFYSVQAVEFTPGRSHSASVKAQLGLVGIEVSAIGANGLLVYLQGLFGDTNKSASSLDVTKPRYVILHPHYPSSTWASMDPDNQRGPRRALSHARSLFSGASARGAALSAASSAHTPPSLVQPVNAGRERTHSESREPCSLHIAFNHSRSSASRGCFCQVQGPP